METLKLNQLVVNEVLDANPSIISHIKNRANSKIGETLVGKITDNGDFIVGVRTEEEPNQDLNATNFRWTVEIKRLIRCHECIHYNAGFECLKDGYGVEHSPSYFCADGKVEE